jgi:hypothetical protein
MLFPNIIAIIKTKLYNEKRGVQKELEGRYRNSDCLCITVAYADVDALHSGILCSNSGFTM